MTDKEIIEKLNEQIKRQAEVYANKDKRIANLESEKNLLKEELLKEQEFNKQIKEGKIRDLLDLVFDLGKNSKE